MESSFSSIFTPTLKKIAVVNYPAHSPLLPRAVETVRDRGKLGIFVIYKKKLKWFLQRILQNFMKKNNTWNIRQLVNEWFVPSAQ